MGVLVNVIVIGNITEEFEAHLGIWDVTYCFYSYGFFKIFFYNNIEIQVLGFGCILTF